jgi:hypothetical protein
LAIVLVFTIAQGCVCSHTRLLVVALPKFLFTVALVTVFTVTAIANITLFIAPVIALSVTIAKERIFGEAGVGEAAVGEAGVNKEVAPKRWNGYCAAVVTV